MPQGLWHYASARARLNKRRLQHDLIGRRARPTRPAFPSSSWWVCPADRFYLEARAQVSRFRVPTPQVADYTNIIEWAGVMGPHGRRLAW